MSDLVDNIMDVIKEEQIKLGYRKERIRLYYPLSSLNILLGTQVASEQMMDQLKAYFLTKTDILGEVGISHKGERFCIELPEQVSEYVNEHTEHSGFLYDFITVISKHGISIDEIVDEFRRYSDAVHFEKMENAEFNYLLYFEDGEPDSYRYCLTQEQQHIIYHRYTKEDYEDMLL